MNGKNRPQPPRGMYVTGDGMLDPRRISLGDRVTKGPARLATERTDAASLSPTIQQLRAVARRALGDRR